MPASPNPRPAKHALKILRHGYASGSQLNLLLVALARAAGYKAYWVHSAQRNRMSFLSKWCNPNQLDNDMVMIRLHGKYLFLTQLRSAFWRSFMVGKRRDRFDCPA